VKDLREENFRRRRTDTADGTEEIEEKAPKLKRSRVEIQEHDSGIRICAWLNNCSCELMYIPKKFKDVANQKLAHWDQFRLSH
jgi:hypothetical protein